MLNSLKDQCQSEVNSVWVDPFQKIYTLCRVDFGGSINKIQQILWTFRMNVSSTLCVVKKLSVVS
jgi:hypothetical protein